MFRSTIASSMSVVEFLDGLWKNPFSPRTVSPPPYIPIPSPRESDIIPRVPDPASAGETASSPSAWYKALTSHLVYPRALEHSRRPQHLSYTDSVEPSSPVASSSALYPRYSDISSTNRTASFDDMTNSTEYVPNVVEGKDIEERVETRRQPIDLDAEFGGPEARKKLERKLLIKLDLRMSILIIIYILNYIDRNNASAARLRGFETDLGLQGQQYNTILSILYVGYILMQIPSNMFLNRIGKPSLYLPLCMTIWGMISILTGVTTNFVGALMTRFFLGFVEAAFFPGSLFLLSKWYKRKELGMRTCMLSCGSLISNAFGTLIATGILDGMENKLNKAAWRWLFFIEGALTIFFAILAIFILPDFPTTSQGFLSPEESRLAVLRMQSDSGLGGVGDEDEAQGEKHARGLKQALTDWKVYFMAVSLTSMVLGLSFNAFFPTLSETMGFDTTVSLLLCAPPWVFATLVAFAVSRHSDKTGERTFHIVGPLCVGIIGFVIAVSTMNTAARYVSLFLMAQSYAGFIVFLAWISNTFARPPMKRAVALAGINAFCQLGNIAGSYIWPTAWGLTYTKSYAICISSFGLTIIMCLIFRQALARKNREFEERELAAGREKGFRYLL